MTVPPFPYFGGKITLAPRIVEFFPAHRHYVEPYAGSLAVLMAKAPSPMETVNDLDGDLMTFWRVLRDRPDDLLRVCALTPHSRAEFEESHDRTDCNDLERARRVHVQLTQGRGATGTRSGWRHYVSGAGSTGMPDYLIGYLRRFAPALERLQHVTLESRPALDLIVKYGADPGVLLYVDPPYLGSARSFEGDPRNSTKRYRHEMLHPDDHSELLAAIRGCAAAVVLSGYPSPLYDDALAGWDRVELAASTGQGEAANRTEVLWSNRTLGEPHLFSEATA